MKAVVFASGKFEVKHGACGHIIYHLPKALEKCFIFPPFSLCQEAKLLPFFLYISPPAWQVTLFLSGAPFSDPCKIGQCDSLSFTAEKT